MYSLQLNAFRNLNILRVETVFFGVKFILAGHLRTVRAAIPAVSGRERGILSTYVSQELGLCQHGPSAENTISLLSVQLRGHCRTRRLCCKFVSIPRWN